MSDVIKNSRGETGVIVEKFSPGTEGKIQKAANERLKKIIQNKKTMKNPKASGGAKDKAKKQNEVLTSSSKDPELAMGGNFLKPVSQYNKGGRAGYRMGGKCKLATKGKGRAYGKNS